MLVNAAGIGQGGAPVADYVTGQTFTIDGGLTMNWGQGA